MHPDKAYAESLTGCRHQKFLESLIVTTRPLRTAPHHTGVGVTCSGAERACVRAR
jgi:hypothetical protein